MHAMSQMDNQIKTIASQIIQLTEAMKELQATVVKLMKTGYIIIVVMLLLLMLF